MKEGRKSPVSSFHTHLRLAGCSHSLLHMLCSVCLQTGKLSPPSALCLALCFMLSSGCHVLHLESPSRCVVLTFMDALCACVCLHMCEHCVCVCVLQGRCGGQMPAAGISSLLPPRESWGLNLGCQVWQWAPLSAEPSHRPGCRE